MQTEIAETVKRQKEFFKSGKTLNVKTRLLYLKKLYKAIKDNLEEIHAALKKDLGKSASESYMCETGLVLSELSHMIKRAVKYASPQKVKTPLAQFASKSYRLPSPYGAVLVIAPWNYPFLLAMDPLTAAVAAGNTVVLKTSAYSPATSEAVKKVISDVFPEEYVCVLFGGAQVNAAMLETRFDYIFFTGSKRVGKTVYEKAAATLTPVTLELGGKSPCIVDETANIPLAAKRIVWGKFLNAGQTCVAPDYVLCSAKIHSELVFEIKKQIEKQFGKQPLKNPDYGKIINEKHFNRLLGLIDSEKVACGGNYDGAELKIEPTVLDGAGFDDAVMQEEIFGPVLPVITYGTVDEAVSYVESCDTPLAAYVFSTDRKRIKMLTSKLDFGGGCVNDVVIHLATPYMPFGGFKESGTGAYHGKAGFDTFTHYKSIVGKSNLIDLPMRYQPYKKRNDKLIKYFLR